MTPFLRTTIDREELASTSDLARELVGSGTVEIPLLVRARRQTRGRGRGDHRWWSDEGSLTFTIAVDPAAHGLRRADEPRLALAVAVGLIEAIEARQSPDREAAPGLGIRWPNDIEVAGRKLGGILPERIETDRGPRLLIGVGLNVTTRLDLAPEPVRAMATSLREWDRGDWDAEALLSAFLERFPALLGRLAGDDPGLPRSWSERDSLRGEMIRLDVGTEIVEGRGGGIDATGGLILVGEADSRTCHGGQVLRTR